MSAVLDVVLGGAAFGAVPAIDLIAARVRGREEEPASSAQLHREKAALAVPVRHAPAKDRRRLLTLAARTGAQTAGRTGSSRPSPRRRTATRRPQPTSR